MAERAQLFEALGALKFGLRPGHETVEGGDPVGVDADMPQGPVGAALGTVSTMRNRPAAEIHRIARLVAHDFDHVWIIEFRRIGYLLAQGGDAGAVSLAQIGGNLVDRGNGDQRFIPLHIDDDFPGAEPEQGAGLLDAVGSAGVAGRGHDHFGPGRLANRGDARVIGGDDDPPRRAGERALDAVPQHWLAREVEQQFTRQAG